jgi:DNA-binding NarL/FixJ family response regulator
MATYIVRIVDRETGLCGVISEVATGEERTFADAQGLLAALAQTEPDPTGRGIGEPDGPPHAGTSQQGAGEADGTVVSIVEPLTRSQLRVCRLAALGKSNPRIAQELFVSRATVESHLHAAYRKLGIASRYALPMALLDAAAA